MKNILERQIERAEKLANVETMQWEVKRLESEIDTLVETSKVSIDNTKILAQEIKSEIKDRTGMEILCDISECCIQIKLYPSNILHNADFYIIGDSTCDKGHLIAKLGICPERYKTYRDLPMTKIKNAVIQYIVEEEAKQKKWKEHRY